MNAHVVVEEFVSGGVSVVDDGVARVVCLSAKSPERLTAYARSLLDHIDRQAIHATAAPPPLDPAVAVLAAEVAGVDAAELKPGDDLGEYGFDRVHLAQLAARLEARYDLPVDPDRFAACRSLADFAALLPVAGAAAAPPAVAGYDLDLARVAYTLQVGRDQMPVRLAVVTTSIAGLRDQLARHLAGDPAVDGVWTGTAAARSVTGHLLDGPEGAAFLAVLRESGDVDKIARIWTAGVDLDWAALHTGPRPVRIPLPTYPFEPRRCWVSAPLRPASAPAAAPPLPPPASDPIAAPPGIEGPALEDQVLDVVAEVLGWRREEVRPEATMEDLGLTSILVNELSTRLGARFGPVEVTALFEHRTIGALARSVAATRPAATTRPVTPSRPVPRSPEAVTGYAVVGMSGRYPMAPDLRTYWENLRAGRDCVTEIPLDRPGWRRYAQLARERYGESYPRWGGFLDDVDAFDPLFFGISPLEARFLDPQERLFIQAAWECVEDAGHTPESVTAAASGAGRSRVGVFAGVTYNNYQMFAASQLERGEWLPVNSQTFSVANRVSYLLDLGGPSLTVDTACSSSLYAVHLACESIRRGECDAAVAGGVNLSLHPSKYVTLAEAGFTAEDGRCRSFGEGGDGYVPAEAVGAVLIKPLDRALADGDRVYAVIRGSAVNHDGRTFGYSVPNPVAQAELVRAALADAGVDPATVSYVEAHGTGTSLGDPIEVRGLSEAFGARPAGVAPCALGSVKSGIGHAEAAAGIAQLHKVALQLTHRTLVPSLTHSAGLNPHIDFDRAGFRVQRDLAPWSAGAHPRRAGVSSFGAGGVNVHVIMEEAPPAVRRPASGTPVVLVLSARTAPALREYAAALATHLRSPDGDTDLTATAWTLQTGRREMAHRLALVAADPAVAAERLHRYATTGAGGDGLWTAVAEPSGEPAGEPGTAEEAAREWVTGRPQRWAARYPDGPPGRVSLPTYPFAREHYWIVDPFADDAAPIAASAAVPPATAVPEGVRAELAAAVPSERSALLTDYLRREVATLLELPDGGPPDPRAGFFDLGMDSVLATRLSNRLEQDLAVEMYANLVFDHPTIAGLSAHLLTLLPAPGATVAGSTVEVTGADTGPGPGPVPDRAERPGLTRMTFTARWEPADPPAAADPAGDGPGGVLLVLDTDDEVYRGLATEQDAFLVLPGDRYARLGPRAFRLRPDEPADHAALLADLGAVPARILDLWPRSHPAGSGRALSTGLHPAFHLAKALLSARPSDPVRLVYLHRFGADGPDPVHEAFAGFGRSVLHENPRLLLRTVGWQETADPAELLAVCRAELAVDGYDQIEVRYRWGRRWTRRLRELPPGTPTGPDPLAGDGATVITGGTGGLGLILARHLARRGPARLVLTGRSVLGDAQRAALAELAGLGAEAVYLSADVTDRHAVDRVVRAARDRFGRISGVIHSAGLLRDGMLVSRELAQAEAVIAPKLSGALHLDAALVGADLDYFVVFSSLAAVGGNAGQTDYAFANRFLNAFAERREERRAAGERRGLTRALIWPFWREGGMRVDAGTEELVLRKLGIGQLDTAAGLETFDTALVTAEPEVGVVQADLARLGRLLPILPPVVDPPSAAEQALHDVLGELDEGVPNERDGDE